MLMLMLMLMLMFMLMLLVMSLVLLLLLPDGARGPEERCLNARRRVCVDRNEDVLPVRTVDLQTYVHTHACAKTEWCREGEVGIKYKQDTNAREEGRDAAANAL